MVLRIEEGQRQVVLVHRPRYGDWSLPKGKPEPDEDLPVTAVREVVEETGLRVRLSSPAGELRYRTDDGVKRTHWWLGVPMGGRLLAEGTPPRKDGTQEVDEARWVGVDEAAGLLTHPDEADLLARALDLDPGHLVLLVRHAKAMQRKHWSGTDAKRPLSGRGRRQSQRLAELLAAYGIAALHSSSSTRCVQTLAPYAKVSGVEVSRHDDLSEESFEDDERGSAREMRRLLGWAADHPEAPMAICGHRPVLPMMRAELRLAPASMLVAEASVVHHDASGALSQVETWKSAF